MEVSGNQTLLDRNKIKIPSYSIKKQLTVHLYNMDITYLDLVGFFKQSSIKEHAGGKKKTSFTVKLDLIQNARERRVKPCMRDPITTFSSHDQPVDLRVLLQPVPTDTVSTV